jgi:hypothetical protein
MASISDGYLWLFCDPNFWWYTFAVLVSRIKMKLAVHIITLLGNLMAKGLKS